MELLVGIHSNLRWLVLLAGALALVVGLMSWFGSGLAERNARQIMLTYVVLFTAQVVLGLIIYLSGNWLAAPMTPEFRRIKLEHPIIMLIALGVAHLTAARARRATRTITAARIRAVGAGLSLALILFGIPWSR